MTHAWWMRREALEARNDVTKRKDLGDFYLNLCSRNVAFGATQNPDSTTLGTSVEETQHVGTTVVGKDRVAEDEMEHPCAVQPVEQPNSDLDNDEQLRSIAEQRKGIEGVAMDVSHHIEGAMGSGTPPKAQDRDKKYESGVDPVKEDVGGSTPPASGNAQHGKQRHNNDEAVSAARQRYLDRKRKRSQQRD